MEINGREAFALLRADGKQSGSFVTFWESTAKNEFSSRMQGRPIFDTILMGEIRSPGDKMSVFSFEIERRIAGYSYANPKPTPGLPAIIEVQPVNKQAVDHRSERWRDVLGLQLEAWEKKREATDLTGTPLESWPKLGVADIASLKASGIYSIEMLANVADGNLDRLGMNARVMREQARNFLELAKGAAPVERLTAQTQEQAEQIKRLQEQLQALSDRYGPVEDKQPAQTQTPYQAEPPRRGRPPKAAHAA